MAARMALDYLIAITETEDGGVFSNHDDPWWGAALPRPQASFARRIRSTVGIYTVVC
jgi:hypothetical protein